MKLTRRVISLMLIALMCTETVISILPRASAASGDEGAELEALISEFMSQNRLTESNFSFAYFNTVTGEKCSFNEDKLMNAASIYKLPLNMYYYEQEALGLISPNKKFAGYPLSQCHMLSLQYSNNETSEAMRYALGTYREFKTLIDKYTGVCAEEIGGKYITGNYYSSYMIMNTLKYLYERSEFFSEAIGYLKAAHPGQYFKKYINDYEIAQKYGYLDTALNTAGIVYTPTPYLLCVFTDRVGYAETVIGRLSELLCDYTVRANSETMPTTRFYDVRTNDWFYSYVESAVELEFINGRGDGRFEPFEELKLSEAVKLACVVHNAFSEAEAELSAIDGECWYDPYIRYAIESGIIAVGQFEDYERSASRAEMAGIFAKCLPEYGFEIVNDIDYIPDVSEDDAYFEEILLLYRLGVLTGSDSDGTFNPHKTITRAEASAIVIRLAA